ncbi:MAG: GFA family protein [Rubrimonas sp.]
MSERTGRCLCGTVRFRAAEVADDLGACWCDMCRRWAGGPFIAAAARGVTFEGAEAIRAYASSDWAERAVCGRCGSTLYFRVTAPGPHGDGAYELAIGLFDDTTGMRLKTEIFVDRQPDAYALQAGLTRKTGAEFLAELGIETPDGQSDDHDPSQSQGGQ